jgi:hypothetical protein
LEPTPTPAVEKPPFGKDKTMSFSIKNFSRFFWNEKYYLLLLPVAMFFGTILHESAHATMAILQGGGITKFSIMPGWSGGHFYFGYVSYWPPPRGFYSESLLSLAPIISWTFIAGLAPLYLQKSEPEWVAKTAIIFLYFLPLGDVAMQLHGLFYQVTVSDLYKGLHGFEGLVAIIALIYFSLFGLLGWKLFQRVHGDSLRGAEFGLGYVLVMAASWFLRP